MPQHRSTAGTVFHLIYNTLYFLLCLLLAALILISPADSIQQAYFTTFQYANIIIIAAAYVVTIIIVLFVYSLRLHVTRTVLASIPKSWLPLGKGDVRKGVRDMVKRELGRSAAIAWEARPKVTAPGGSEERPGLGIVIEEEAGNEAGNETWQEAGGDEEKIRTLSSNWMRLKKVGTVESEMGIALPPTRPVWGIIEHPGWGSPDSPDVPNIQYSSVLAELPNLIEGKAISLAPTDLDSAEPTALDPDAVALLQRTVAMGMRGYVEHLISLGVLPSSKDVTEFLDMYERARFSTRPMPVATFRHLMQLFASLLHTTQTLDRSVIDTVHEMDGMYTDSEGNMDIDDDAPLDTSPTTPSRSLRSLESEASPRTQGRSNSRHLSSRPRVVARNSSGMTWGQYGTAPTTPKSRAGRSGTVNSRNQRPRSVVSRRESAWSGASSANSFSQTRRPFMASGSPSSRGSSVRSGSQGSGGSVIRLARRDDAGDLPYVLRLGDNF
jgi:uncharacterized integral membrane protein